MDIIRKHTRQRQGRGSISLPGRERKKVGIYKVRQEQLGNGGGDWEVELRCQEGAAAASSAVTGLVTATLVAGWD